MQILQRIIEIHHGLLRRTCLSTIYLILIFGHKIWTKSKGVRPHECDFYTGKDIIDREEEEFLAAQAAEKANKPEKRGARFYRRFVSWLF